MTAMWVLGFPRATRRLRILNPRFCGWIVLSTLRRAFELDFRSVVLKDACFDADQEVHRVLTEKVFPRHAWVAATDEFIAAQKG